jgi:hypothetical protein
MIAQAGAPFFNRLCLSRIRPFPLVPAEIFIIFIVENLLDPSANLLMEGYHVSSRILCVSDRTPIGHAYREKGL